MKVYELSEGLDTGNIIRAVQALFLGQSVNRSSAWS